MALGFPWKKKARIEEEGGKGQADCNCTFHLGLRWAAKTIAPLESQVCFHARSPEERGGTRRGAAERSDSHGDGQQNTIFC